MKTIFMSLAALVVLGIGAVGGYFYGMNVGIAQANDIRSQFAAQRGLTTGAAGAGGAGGTGGAAATQGGQGGFGGFGGQGGAGGQGTFGSVKSVEGNTIELTSAQGATVKVTVTDQT